jgi:uncharacterized delta-60 repeat protein
MKTKHRKTHDLLSRPHATDLKGQINGPRTTPTTRNQKELLTPNNFPRTRRILGFQVLKRLFSFRRVSVGRGYPIPVFRINCCLRMLGHLALWIPFFIQAASNTELYETSFEAPTFVPGSPIRGQDNWEMFHDGEAISVSTNNARTGTQCLRFDGALLEQVGPNVSRAYGFTRALDATASNPPPIVEISAWVRLDGPQIGSDGSPTNDLMSANFYAVGSAFGQPMQLGGFIVSSAGRIFADNYKLSAPMTFGVYHQLTIRVDFVARTLRYWMNGTLLGESALAGQADRLLSAYVEMIGPTEPTVEPFPYDPTSYTAYVDDYRIVSIPLSPVNTVIEFGATSYPYTNFLADEFETTAKLRLIRRGFTNAAVRVTLSTSDGTAIAGQDYQAVSTFVTFAPGETNKIVEVSLTADDYWPEPDKTFTARLTGLPPGATSPRSRAMVVIRDDERPGSIDSSWSSDFGLPPLGLGVTEYTDPRFVLRQPDGKLVFDVVVYDSDLNRQLYWHLIRLNSDGSLDSSYPVRDSYPSDPQNVLGERTVTAMPDGSLLVVDYESRPGNDGLLHYLGHRLRYKLHPDGSIVPNFPSLTNSTAAGCCGGFLLIPQSDGKILVSGNVSNPIYVNDQKMPSLFRLLGDGTVDDTFEAPAILIGQIHVLKNGQILIKEPFSPEKLHRLNSDGTLDSTFTPPAGVVFSLPPLLEGLPNDLMLISGRSGGTTKLYRLQQSGAPDSEFSVGTVAYASQYGSSGFIDIALLQPNGRLLVAGGFRTYNGQIRNSLVQLNVDGTVDSSFSIGKGFVGTGLSATDPGQVQQLQPLPNGQLWVSGVFDQLNGEKVTPPIILNPDGSRDTSFLGTLVDAYGGIGPAYTPLPGDSSIFVTSRGLGRIRRDFPLRIVSAHHNPDGTTQLLANALPGRGYTLQASENLSDWLDLTTQVATTNRIEFNDTPTTALPRRLYRVKQN